MIAAIVLVSVGWSLGLVAWVAAIEYPQTARRLFCAAAACVTAGLLCTSAGRIAAWNVARVGLLVAVPVAAACGFVAAVLWLAKDAPTEDQP